MLPPGVHPNDPSIPIPPGQVIHSLNEPDIVPVDEPLAPPQLQRDRYFPTANPNALATYERGTSEFLPRTWQLSSGQDPMKIANRQKGRKAVALWVPASSPIGTPSGVIIGRLPEDCYTFGVGGIVLMPGDAITLPTEAPIYAAVIPGNSTGFVYSVSFQNPPGS